MTLKRFRSWLRPFGDRPAATPALREEGLLTLQRAALPNGLRVWVKPRPGAGTVAVMMQVPVGSRHETEANNGVSHFVEHMLFTGTSRWNEHQVTEVIRRRGGQVNARTGSEDTVFWLHLRSEDLDLALDWLAEVLFRSTLGEDKFKKERGVIIQEKGGEWGRFKAVYEFIEDIGLGWNVFRAVRNRLFPDSSLLLPVIGDDASLGRLRHADVVEFYRRHYLVNNMTLVVVGDVRAPAVIEKANRYFGGFPAGERPPRPTTPPPPSGGFNIRLRGPNINNQGQLLLGAPLPGMSHPDRYPFGVLAEMLDTALTRKIRYERGLVYGIEISLALYSDVGYFVVYTTADSAKFPEILAEVEAQIEQAIAGQVDPQAVEEAKTAIRGRALLAMEGNLDLAGWLAEDALYTPDDQPVPDFFSGIGAVTSADVQRVAATYLAKASRYQAIHRPGVTPARLLTPTIAALGSGAALAGVWLWRRLRRTGKLNRRS